MPDGRDLRLQSKVTTITGILEEGRLFMSAVVMPVVMPVLMSVLIRFFFHRSFSDVSRNASLDVRLDSHFDSSYGSLFLFHSFSKASFHFSIHL